MIPEQEINATERDQFWQKEEMEEKKRLEQERVRQEKERQKLEQEIRAREEKETQLREQKVCHHRSVFVSLICHIRYQITCVHCVRCLKTKPFSLSGDRQREFNRAAEVGRATRGKGEQYAQSVGRSEFQQRRRGRSQVAKRGIAQAEEQRDATVDRAENDKRASDIREELGRRPDEDGLDATAVLAQEQSRRVDEESARGGSDKGSTGGEGEGEAGECGNDSVVCGASVSGRESRDDETDDRDEFAAGTRGTSGS